MDNYLIHYGVPRRSGRYPYGSGEKPFQREPDWLRNLKKKETIVELEDLSDLSTEFEKSEKKAKKRYDEKAFKYSAKTEKILTGPDKSGVRKYIDNARLNRYSKKALKFDDKALESDKMAKAYKSVSKKLKKEIADISKDKIDAGKHYIDTLQFTDIEWRAFSEVYSEYFS